MNETDNKIDQLLKSHLKRELDRHLGTCQEAFAAELRRPTPRPWQIFRYWAAAAIFILAASLAAAIVLKSAFNRPLPRQTVGSSSQGAPQNDPPPLMPIAQTLDWQTVDDGTVMLNGDVPVRQLRRQFIERTRWYDEKRKTTIELAVPQEQVMLIGHW
jgi:hypothetical protein